MMHNKEEMPDFMNNNISEIWIKRHMEKRRKGKIIAGLLLIAGGALYLAKLFGAPIWPQLFSFPVFLMAFGLYLLVRNSFRKPFGLVIIAVGAALLINKLYPGYDVMQYAIPIIVIGAGISMVIFSSSLRHKKKLMPFVDKYKDWENKNQYSVEDRVEEQTIFGGINRTVISKNFQGGNISSIMGGVEINLMQADFETRAIINLNVIMGGVTLIVPTNWVIVNEVTAIMGGAEDSRPNMGINHDQNKVLVVSGSVIMGGLEIKSY